MLDTALARLASATRLGHARAPGDAVGPRPKVALVLYEYEHCPMCRRVREALTDLALPVDVRPCPRGGTRFRPEAEARAGRMQFPFLVDPNTDTALLESTDIVAYLYATYGTGEPPAWLFGAGFVFTAQLASMVRMASAGVAPAALPDAPILVSGHENDPGARRVREQLCRMEVPYRRVPGPLALESDDVRLEDADAILAWLEDRIAA